MGKVWNENKEFVLGKLEEIELRFNRKVFINKS